MAGEITSFLTQKIGPLPLWVYGGVGAIGIALIAPRFIKKGVGGKSTGGLGNTVSPPPDPNIDPNTGIPWSVEEAIDPNTGLPYWATLFGPPSQGNAPPQTYAGPSGGNVPPQPTTQPPPGNVPPQPELQGAPPPSGLKGAPPPRDRYNVPPSGYTGGRIGPADHSTYNGPAPGNYNTRPQRGGGPGTAQHPMQFISPAPWPEQEHTLENISQNHGVSIGRLQQLNPWILQERGNWSVFTTDKIRVA